MLFLLTQVLRIEQKNLPRNGCNVIQYVGDDQTASSMASFLSNSTLIEDFSNLIIYVTDEWKLRELPVVVNRSREGWDIYISYNNELGTQDLISEDLVIGSLDIDHLFLSKRGLNELAKSNSMTSTSNFPSELRVRVIESSDKIKLPQRESLATASRFAQLFYWMLETKHPLFLFGIPGIVLFILGYRLSGNVVDTFNELNSVSIGFDIDHNCNDANRIVCDDGRPYFVHNGQVEQIQSQYNWNNPDDKTT